MLSDMSHVGLKNVDPGVPKMLMAKVFPSLPIRVGRFVIFNPPWIVGHIILPIVFALMSKKLRSRILLIKGDHPKKIQSVLPKTAVPESLAGTLPVDEDKITEGLIAKLPK